MERKVHGTNRPWYEKSTNGTKRLRYEKSIVRKVWFPAKLCRQRMQCRWPNYRSTDRWASDWANGACHGRLCLFNCSNCVCKSLSKITSLFDLNVVYNLTVQLCSNMFAMLIDNNSAFVKDMLLETFVGDMLSVDDLSSFLVTSWTSVGF